MDGKAMRDRLKRGFRQDERHLEIGVRATRVTVLVGVILGFAQFVREWWVHGIVRTDILSIWAAMIIAWTATMIYLGLTR